MSSRIGRKSSFSHELANIREPLNGVKEGMLIEREVLPGIVLDICSSYNPKSLFIDSEYQGYKNFSTGIYFIIGLYGAEEIAVVAWKKPEDELRTIYGTDENIIGRECNVICNKASPDGYLKADIFFNKSLSSGIKSYNKSEYMSNSFFSNTPTNYLDQTKGANANSSFGEVWRKIEK
jgi:hypothetical protein